MQKVIGLDIGSYSIKAIEIINTFKSYEVVNFYETVIPVLQSVPLDAVVPICMEQLFRENNVKADRIITAMPGQFISSRVLPFSFSDPRKIEASVMVELEEHVPFNMDDMIVDHQILGLMRQKTMVLAVMTRKAFLKNFLDLLTRINIDPKLVDIDSLAFYNLSSHLNITADHGYAIVDVGHEKTSVCIIKDGMLRMFRSINIGGRYISEFLARDLEVSFQEAVRIKHRIGRVIADNLLGGQAQTGGEAQELIKSSSNGDLSPQDRMVAERITMATSAIVKELGRTFYAYKNWDKEPLGQVFISGGTSKLIGLSELWSQQLEIPVSKLDILSAGLKIEESVTKHAATIPQSLAIGLRAVTNVKKHSQINLRRGEFAYVQNYEAMLKTATSAFKLIGIAILLLVISYTVKHYFYKSQIDELKATFIKEYEAVFPKAKASNLSFVALRNEATTKLNAGINESQNGLQEFIKATSHSPTVEISSALSQKIPKDLVIDVNHFEYKHLFPGQGKVTIKAETDDFEKQSKIIDLIKEIPMLDQVVEGKSGAKVGSKDKKIEFTVEASYQAGRG